MTVRSWSRCWMASASHAPVDAGDHGRAQTASSLTRATVTHAVAARPGRPLLFDKAIYARRNVVERCINRLKQWRGLATRYEKRAGNYRAMLVLASIVLWLES
jgi:transposase